MSDTPRMDALTARGIFGPMIEAIAEEGRKLERDLARCQSVGEIKTARIRSLEGEVEECRAIIVWMKADLARVTAELEALKAEKGEEKR